MFIMVCDGNGGLYEGQVLFIEQFISLGVSDSADCNIVFYTVLWQFGHLDT